MALSPAALDLALLRGAMEEIPLGVATLREENVLYANCALERMLGADPGGLEGQSLEALFDAPTVVTIRAFLDDRRMFDGRIHAKTFDKRDLTAELHIERYQSGGGVGGFLLMRDVSMEAGALNRLLNQLGGVTVRVRVDQTAIEAISPSIVEVAGIEARTVMADPSCLRSLASETDQQRVAGAYQRLARGETDTETVNLVIRKSADCTAAATLHGTGRRDTSGVVRHVDAALIPQMPRFVPTNPSAPTPGEFTGLSAMIALCDTANDLLREAAQLSTSAASELRTVRAEIASAMPTDAASDVLDRLDHAGTSLAAANAINRRVRRAMDTRVSRAAVRDVFDTIRVTLGPLVGEDLVIDPGEVADTELDNRVDEVTLALMQLVLRTVRLCPGGAISVRAHRSRTRPKELVVQIDGNGGNGDRARPSEAPSTGSRRPDADQTLSASATLLATAGCVLETDERNGDGSRTLVRIRAASLGG